MLTPRMISRLNARFFQYALQSTLPNQGAYSDLAQVAMQSGFHFWSEFLTITYNTLADGSATDDGVCRFSAQFKSGGNQIGLSNGQIDLATIAAPGRVRTIGIAGDPAQQLHIQGLPWPYLYEATGAIIADVRKAGTGVGTVKFVWTGFLIPLERCRTAEEFYGILADEYPDFGNNPGQQ